VSLPAKSEFFRPVSVEGLEEEGRTFRIEAESDERKALAERFGLVSVEHLAAEGRIYPETNRDLLRLEARLIADVVQSCVVTLVPVASRIDVTFEQVYGTGVENERSGREHQSREVNLTLEDDFAPEPLFGDSVDVGEVVAEHLALELNPFPRAAGAVFEGLADVSEEASEAATHQSPFAALAALRAKSGDEV
jgi:uncharacterized metal-binding protein YceD (DUF177 family)